jgi:hypothetical protein
MYIGVSIFEALVVMIEGLRCQCFGGLPLCAGEASSVKADEDVVKRTRVTEVSSSNRVVLFIGPVVVDVG